MDILTFSKSVPDCRDEKNRLYDASELVFISLAAVLCGSDTWNDVEEFCEYNFKYFKERLPNLRGVPSHDTLNRFFSVLDTSWFEKAFRDWVGDICDKISGVVAIDGNTYSFDELYAKQQPESAKMDTIELHIVLEPTNATLYGVVSPVRFKSKKDTRKRY